MGPQRRVLARQAGLIAALLLAASCTSGDDPAVAPVTTTTTTAPPACASTVRAGNERITLGDRWYHRWVPPAHDGSRPVPLLVDLHGYSEDPVAHVGATRWATVASDEGFVLVAPAGVKARWDLAADGIDVAFIGQLLDDVESSLCIDPDRIYVTGYSMGGFLISTLACTELANRVAAMAPVAGVRAVPDCAPPRAVPALVMHGSADGTVFYDGGINKFASDLLELPMEGPSVPAIVDAWAVRNGCESPPVQQAIDRITRYAYQCPPGAEVELQRVEGEPHGWPEEANAAVWAFFERHPLDS